MDDRPFVVKRLLALIDEGGPKQDAVERGAGLPPGRISKWRKTGEPTASQVVSIAAFFGVNPMLFLVDVVDELGELTEDERTVLEWYRDLKHFRGVAAAQRAMAKPMADLPERPSASAPDFQPGRPGVPPDKSASRKKGG